MQYIGTYRQLSGRAEQLKRLFIGLFLIVVLASQLMMVRVHIDSPSHKAHVASQMTQESGYADVGSLCVLQLMESTMYEDLVEIPYVARVEGFVLALAMTECVTPLLPLLAMTECVTPLLPLTDQPALRAPPTRVAAQSPALI